RGLPNRILDRASVLPEKIEPASRRRGRRLVVSRHLERVADAERALSVDIDPIDTVRRPCDYDRDKRSTNRRHSDSRSRGRTDPQVHRVIRGLNRLGHSRNANRSISRALSHGTKRHRSLGLGRPVRRPDHTAVKDPEYVERESRTRREWSAIPGDDETIPDTQR